MIYPKTIKENMLFRAQVDDACRKDKKTLQLVYDLCKSDVLFFVNMFLFAEDPFAEKGFRHGIDRIRLRPIVTYPVQDEYILDLNNAIDTGEAIIADKSRDMLATYMVLAVYFHRWLFKGNKFLITSWKEGEIDGKDDTSTHFGKLRLFLKMLPPYLKPVGFDLRRNSSYMSLRNPENGGTLIGSAASPNLGSGRREDSIFYDELSKWETNADEAWTSGSDATLCKVGVWTPHGSGNLAAELMRGDEVKRKHHLMWWRHPEKTYCSENHLELVKSGKIYDKVGGYVVRLHEDQSKSPEGCYVDQNGKIHSQWYDEECVKRKVDDIAENLDCNYLTTGNPVFDVEKCKQKKYESKAPIATGELMWKIRPIFSENKICVNQQDLAVEFVPNSNGLVSIWEHPVNDYYDGYCISADCAEGLEQGDYDASRVLRRFPLEAKDISDFKPKMVATIHGHLPMHQYAEELAKLAVYYGYAYVAVERNNHGHAVINELLYFYPKLYHADVMTKGYPERSDKIGFETNRASKPIIVNKLSKGISLDEFIDPDERFWDEALTFINSDGKMEAQGKSQGQKCFDDIVMSTAILWYINEMLPAPTKKRIKRKELGWKGFKTDKTFEDKSLVRWVV